MPTRLEYDEWGRMVVIREESPEPLKELADLCQSLQNEGLTGDKELPHLAEFPGFLIEQYCHINGIEWGEWFRDPVHCQRMLNDPDLAHFRIHKGRV